MNRFFVGLMVSVVWVVLVRHEAAALSFQLTKVVDENTPLPGQGVGTFNGLDDDGMAISGQHVLILCTGDANGDSGLYLHDGVLLTEVAFEGDPVPGLPGVTFSRFDDDMHGMEVSSVGFRARFDDGVPDNGYDEVVITAAGGVLTNRADTVNTICPSTGTTFDGLYHPGLSGGAVAFCGGVDDGTGNVSTGVYTDASGTLTTVVDTSTPVPGLPGHSFFSFSQYVAFDGSIGILAYLDDWNDETAFLATPEGALTPIADTISTLSPSTGVVFENLNNPVVEGSYFVFGGTDADGFEGIYTNVLGGLSVVADENTDVPAQPGETFLEFRLRQLSMDGTRIVFEGTSTAGLGGIYLWDNGVLSLVVEKNIILDGRPVLDFNLTFADSMSGDRILLQVDFPDGFDGIYVAEPSTTGAVIPEPATIAIWSLLAGLGIGVGWRRRKRV